MEAFLELSAQTVGYDPSPGEWEVLMAGLEQLGTVDWPLQGTLGALHIYLGRDAGEGAVSVGVQPETAYIRGILCTLQTYRVR